MSMTRDLYTPDLSLWLQESTAADVLSQDLDTSIAGANSRARMLWLNIMIA